MREEIMSPAFTKYHLDGLPFDAVLHKFSTPEGDKADPHDHPWGFTTHILKGGYVEENFTHWPDGTWTSHFKRRYPGRSHHVHSGHIHRITELLADECWTLVIPDGPAIREAHFWRFDEANIYFRPWHQAEFKIYREWDQT